MKKETKAQGLNQFKKSVNKNPYMDDMRKELKISRMQTKRIEKKLDGNYTRMLRAILNKSLRQHPTKQQLYGHLPPITKTVKIKRTRHAGHC